MNRQMFDHDLRLEVMIHDGEGRIYSAQTYETEGESKGLRLYLALKIDQKNSIRPYWTSNPKMAYRTMDVALLRAYVKEVLTFTDYKLVYIAEMAYRTMDAVLLTFPDYKLVYNAEKDNGLITCLDNPRLDKKKGGKNDQQ